MAPLSDVFVVGKPARMEPSIADDRIGEIDVVDAALTDETLLDPTWL